jgi:hypothetical protein
VEPVAATKMKGWDAALGKGGKAIVVQKVHVVLQVSVAPVWVVLNPIQLVAVARSPAHRARNVA